MANLNLSKLLNAMEEKDSEQTFFAKLASTPAEEKVTPAAAPETATTPVKVEEPVKVAEVNTEMDKEMLQKVAESYDDAGRIMARGFYDEFQKLAVGYQTADTPNITPALQVNPAVQLSQGTPAHQAETSRVGAIINSLRSDTLMPAGTISVRGEQRVAVIPPDAPDRGTPTAADVMEAQTYGKTAGDRIMEKLWARHVEGKDVN